MSVFLSIVSPVYNAEFILDKLVSSIIDAVSTLEKDYEIILVDDGSPDNSWAKMQFIAASNPNVKIVKLSRNFGQHYAISAGLDQTNGEWVVVMDCDLQDQPIEILNMLCVAQQDGAKVVLGQRKQRQDNLFKIYFSNLFYIVLSYLSGTKWDSSIANFGLYHRDVVLSIRLFKEPIRFFPSMVKWVGFKTVKMEVAHQAREEGKSNYSFKKRIKLAIDIILANSDKPLRIIVKFGFTVSMIAALIGLIYIIRYMTGQIKVMGYTSLMISIWFVGGVMFMLLGLIGLYIGKIFEAAKERPVYIIEEKNNF